MYMNMTSACSSALGKLRQEDCYEFDVVQGLYSEFQISVSYGVRSCLKRKKEN